MRRLFFRQKAYALLPCTLLLTAVLLVTSASLRTVRLQLNAMQANADMQMARVSAESSMVAAEHHLQTLVQDAPDDEESNLSAEYFTSLCVTPRKTESPYRLDVLWSDKQTGVCRVTATGQGHMTGAQISLQADFELRSCQSPAETAKSVMQTDMPDMPEYLPAACRSGLRLLSWRVLNEV